MKRSFIVTAGGIGKRMGTEVPKQFLLLNNKPILMHTIERLHAFDKVAEIIVTLPEEYIELWEDLSDKFQFGLVHTIVEGGEERFFSIQNALHFCSGDTVAVHDGVRPFVSDETLQRLFEKSTQSSAVIPVVAVHETLRKVMEGSSKTVPRSEYALVQTPQVFKRTVLEEAYNQEYSELFTDDASVVESLGYGIALVDGNEENIKITTPADLAIAQALLGSRD